MTESGVTYSIETVDTREEAARQIAAACEQGVDPWELYRGHLSLARHMKELLEVPDV